MLRITTVETQQSISLLLEGKLSGPWVDELDQLFAVQKASARGRLIILDLSGLTGADAAGRYLLALMQREGARLENANPLASCFLNTPSSELRVRGRESQPVVILPSSSASGD